MILQKPPVYDSKESAGMKNWFTRLYTILKEATTLGTTVATTSGTSHDFTGVPPGTSRITINFSGLSTNGTSDILVQIGDAGGIETTGYTSSSTQVSGTPSSDSSTSGFILTDGIAATVVYEGSITLSLLNPSTSLWVSSGVLSRDGPLTVVSAGSKTLSNELTQLRLTTVNGSDTFDAGSVNILMETDL